MSAEPVEAEVRLQGKWAAICNAVGYKGSGQDWITKVTFECWAVCNEDGGVECTWSGCRAVVENEEEWVMVPLAGSMGELGI